MEKVYPKFGRRIISSSIDELLPVIIFVLSIAMIKGDNEFKLIIRFLIPCIFFILYEPILTSKACTLGQFITKIRVRKNSNYQRISLPASFLRYLVKFLLGGISFFIIIFSERSRAIHDFCAGSIVIEE
jgi:uncharacterized RDD family membrane protein YckC